MCTLVHAGVHVRTTVIVAVFVHKTPISLSTRPHLAPRAVLLVAVAAPEIYKLKAGAVGACPHTLHTRTHT